MALVYPIIEPKDVLEKPAAVRRLLESGISYLQVRSPERWGEEEEGMTALRSAAATLRGMGPVPSEIIIIINNDVRLAGEFGFGVHLGRRDMPVGEARSILGDTATVGMSTNRPEEWENLDGVSYLAVGPIYDTTTKAKPNPTRGIAIIREARLAMSRRNQSVPLVAIGGINLTNYRKCVAAGADLVAAISAFRGGDGSLRDDAAEIAGQFC